MKRIHYLAKRRMIDSNESHQANESVHEVAPTALAADPLCIQIWCGFPAERFSWDSDRHYPEEAPVHKVRVDGFWMDRCTVTNREFERFVRETGHVTWAEKPANPG